MLLSESELAHDDVERVAADSGQEVEPSLRLPHHVAGSNPRYAATGHLLFARDGALMAAPFDVDDVRVTGPPTQVLDNLVTSTESGPAPYAVSRNGTLVYVAGGPAVYDREIVRVDLDGSTTPLPNVDPGIFNLVATSPSGTAGAHDWCRHR